MSSSAIPIPNKAQSRSSQPKRCWISIHRFFYERQELGPDVDKTQLDWYCDQWYNLSPEIDSNHK